MNADEINLGSYNSAFSMVEESGNNLAPPIAPPKANKRKNHRGGRKSKKKQQDPLTAPKDVPVTSTVEATTPTLAKKQRQTKRKTQRKSAKAPIETTITASDTITERQDDVAVRVIKDDCVSPTANDDTTNPRHSLADSLTLDISRSRDVDVARAEASEAISSVEPVSVGISGETTVCSINRLERGLESVHITDETSITDDIRVANGMPPFELRPTPGKGVGMHTTRPIARGTRILSQSPLMLLGDEENLSDIPSKFANLPIEEQTTFLSLTAAPLERQNKDQLKMLVLQRIFEPEKARGLSMNLQMRLLSIFETNSFAAGAGAAVVATAARMNHSCTPNVYHCWNATTGQLTVHATRDLTSGEEILTCYVDVCCYREARQKALDCYGFVCDCAACCMQTDLGRKSEKRRQRLCALKGEIVTKCTTSQTGHSDIERGALDAVLQIINILREEGLTNMELTRHYCMAADFSESLGDIEQACEWAKKALDLTEVCTGTDYVAYWMNEENLHRLVERRDEAMKFLRARI